MRVIFLVTYVIVFFDTLSAFPLVKYQEHTRTILPSQEIKHRENSFEHSRPKRGVFNLIPQRPLSLKDLLKSSLRQQEDLLTSNDRSKRGVFNLIPKPKDMTMAKLVAFEDMLLSKEILQLSEHKRKSHNRRRLMRLLRNILKEELRQSKK